MNLISMARENLNEVVTQLSVHDTLSLSSTSNYLNSVTNEVSLKRLFKSNLLSAPDRKCLNSKLECLLVSKNPKDREILSSLFAKTSIALQVDLCYQFINSLHKPQLGGKSKDISFLYNDKNSINILKINALDFACANRIPIKVTKESLKHKGLIPKRFKSFDPLEVPTSFANNINTHPDQKFVIGELVTVIAKVEPSKQFSMYFGVVTADKDKVYTISLKYNEVEWEKLELRKSSQIGKLPRISRFPKDLTIPSFCIKGKVKKSNLALLT